MRVSPAEVSNRTGFNALFACLAYGFANRAFVVPTFYPREVKSYADC